LQFQSETGDFSCGADNLSNTGEGSFNVPAWWYAVKQSLNFNARKSGFTPVFLLAVLVGETVDQFFWLDSDSRGQLAPDLSSNPEVETIGTVNGVTLYKVPIPGAIDNQYMLAFDSNARFLDLMHYFGKQPGGR
jgi:hypothetical protein